MEAEISKVVADALSAISQKELRVLGMELIVMPRMELRDWDCGAIGQQYPCWIVLEHQQSNTAIAYCTHGFGPTYPWGLLCISGDHLSMDMDCNWFKSLEDALRNCQAWAGDNPLGYEIE